MPGTKCIYYTRMTSHPRVEHHLNPYPEQITKPTKPILPSSHKTTRSTRRPSPPRHPEHRRLRLVAKQPNHHNLPHQCHTNNASTPSLCQLTGSRHPGTQARPEATTHTCMRRNAAPERRGEIVAQLPETGKNMIQSSLTGKHPTGYRKYSSTHCRQHMAWHSATQLDPSYTAPARHCHHGPQTQGSSHNRAPRAVTAHQSVIQCSELREGTFPSAAAVHTSQRSQEQCLDATGPYTWSRGSIMGTGTRTSIRNLRSLLLLQCASK